MRVVCLPPSKLAYRPSRAARARNGRESITMAPRVPLVGAKRRPAQTARPPLIGRRASRPIRPSERPPLRPAAVSPEGREAREGLSLVSRAPRIAIAISLRHTAILVRQLPLPLTALARCSALRRLHVASRAIVRRPRLVFSPAVGPRPRLVTLLVSLPLSVPGKMPFSALTA